MKTSLTTLIFLLAFFSLFSDTLAQPFRGGLKRTKDRDILIGASVSDEDYAKLPRLVSYEEFCPTPAHQGDREMTVAFASAYYLRTILENQVRNVRDQAGVNGNRFSPTYLYSRIKLKDDVDCQSGASVEAALEALRRDGVPLLKSVGNQVCNPPTSAALEEEAGRYRMGEYKVLYGAKTQPQNRLRLLKKALADGTPVLVEFLAPESFTLARKIWTPATNETSANAGLGLALCVIGYDDSQAGGAFRVVNSWGTAWGDAGKCWIRYNDMTTFAPTAYQVSPLSPTDRPTLLTGRVDLRLVGGAEVPLVQTAPGSYQPKGIYPAEKQVKLVVNSGQPMHLYLLAMNGNEVKTYVPDPGKPAPIVKSGESFTFGEVITLDKALGNDYLLFLYSRQPVSDLNAFQNKLRKAAGTPEQKVVTVLIGMSDEKAEYGADGMSFSLTTKQVNVIVPVLLRL